MPRTSYALLAHGDLFPPPIPRLYSCVHDVNDVGAFLLARADHDSSKTIIQTLRDQQATRVVVVARFRSTRLEPAKAMSRGSPTVRTGPGSRHGEPCRPTVTLGP